MCWHCDYKYAERVSDGKCYGKYFVCQLIQTHCCGAIGLLFSDL